MKINIPESKQERVVIVGGGFAGLTLAKNLAKQNYQVVLIDKNNYHQFQPLFYQVAMAGLEPSSIIFPLRKYFQDKSNTFIRVTEVHAIYPDRKQLDTPIGIVNYDKLILATGADTNFFGNEEFAKHCIPMKSVSEALFLRNRILTDYEHALSITDYELRQQYIDIVIVGGGPTGVEIAGALAEMKKYIIPKDYQELNTNEIDIYLVQNGDQLLKGMSDDSADKALTFLRDLGVKVILNDLVTHVDGENTYLKSGQTIPAKKVIWAAGIKGNIPDGISREAIGSGNRIKVNAQLQVEMYPDIFAIGDVAICMTDNHPYGHPQVAQVAMQQAKYLAKHLRPNSVASSWPGFQYKNLGAMATVGRHRAVVDLPRWKFQGAFAWFVWLFVHLFQILGAKNKLFVFINWVWNYITYDQSLRLIIRPFQPKKPS
ncbi:MAG: NAD(P)/FAD-dependent oxidoreductase [Saprospiraceae bacterium]|nr:NAD(P)/FAD-dependent oxidoreductase [Saprospiraceae bacterium]